MLSLLRRLFAGDRDARHPQRRPSIRSRVGAKTRQPGPTAKPPATELLDNPKLSIDAPEDPGFDPYNTGAFSRSGSWERITKRRNN